MHTLLKDWEDLFAPKYPVEYTDEGAVISVNLAGYSKKDVGVEFDVGQGLLHITAENKRKGKKESKLYISNYYGDSPECEMEDGELKIALKKDKKKVVKIL